MESSQNPLYQSPPQTLPKTKDPRMIFLLVLAAIILLLLLAAAIVPSFRRRSPSSISQTTPAPIVSPTPTPLPEANRLPENLSAKFDKIIQNNNQSVNFPPPQIDPDIGL